MNQIFEFKRFFLLLRNILDVRLKYVLLLPVLIILFQFFMFLNELYESGSYIRVDFQSYFYFGNIIGLGLIAFLFSKIYLIGDTNKTSFIMIPASSFEKWLAITLVTLVPFTVLFLLFSIGFENIRIQMVNNYIAGLEQKPDVRIESFWEHRHEVLKFISLFWAMALFILISATYFKKMPIILTLASIIAIGYIGYGINLGFANMVLAEEFAVGSIIPFENLSVVDRNNMLTDGSALVWNDYKMQDLRPWIYLGAHPVLIIGFMVLFYHRIKETQG